MFLRAAEPRTVKNRVYLDLRCESFETEKVRLGAAGATVLAEYGTFVVMADPEGDEFCLSQRIGP